MRHIALLSLLSISLSAPAFAASQQDLKAKLAEARIEAQSEIKGTSTAVQAAAPVLAAPKPLLDVDTMPKAGTTIPLASSSKELSAATSSLNTLPVIPPVTAADKAALTKKAPVVAAPVVAPAPIAAPVTVPAVAAPKAAKPETIKAAEPVLPSPVMETQKAAIAPQIAPAPKTMPTEIVWNENETNNAVVPVKSTTESIIPTTKLQPVTLPSIIDPVRTVARKPEPQNVQPVIQEKPVAEIVQKPVVEKSEKPVVAEETKIAAVAEKKQPAPAPATVKKEEPKKETKAEAKPKQEVKKQAAKPVAEPKPAFLDMPQAMPAAKPRVIDSTNTTQIVSEKAAIPAVPVLPPVAEKQKMPSVPASTAIGPWSARMIGDVTKQDSAFCLLENKFDNNMSLMIGQRADGYSTLGINYGVDMLSGGRNYSALVMIDESFEENFNGYAESGNMLIVQLGKKPSFFAMLANAQHLRVMIPGVASNFATQGIAGALEEFSNCMNSIGGTLAKAAPVATIAPNQTMPVVATPVVQADNLNAPSGNAVMPPVVTSDAAPALPSPVATNSTVQKSTTPKLPPASNWSVYVSDILNSSGIRPQNIQESAAAKEWTVANGMLHGQVWQVAGTDVLEAAMTQLDNAEKECGGQFTNQIGAPEMINGHVLQLMESKCTSAQGVSVSTWLVQQNHSGITAWEMRAPQTQHVLGFEVRQKIMDAVSSQPNS